MIVGADSTIWNTEGRSYDGLGHVTMPLKDTRVAELVGKPWVSGCFQSCNGRFASFATWFVIIMLPYARQFLHGDRHSKLLNASFFAELMKLGSRELHISSVGSKTDIACNLNSGVSDGFIHLFLPVRCAPHVFESGRKYLLCIPRGERDAAHNASTEPPGTYIIACFFDCE